MTHICVSKLTITGSDNGLSPGRRQAIIWTNAGILLIRTLGTNFSEISIEIHTFSFKKMSAKQRPFCLGLNVLMSQTSTLCSSPNPPSQPCPKLLLHRGISLVEWRALTWRWTQKWCKQMTGSPGNQPFLIWSESKQNAMKIYHLK